MQMQKKLSDGPADKSHGDKKPSGMIRRQKGLLKELSLLRPPLDVLQKQVASPKFGDMQSLAQGCLC